MNPRIGVSTGGCGNQPILDVLDALGGGPVRGLEIGTPRHHFDPGRQADVAAVRERLDHVALRAVSIHAPFGGSFELSDPDPTRRQAAIAAVLAAATAIRDLGGSIVVAHVTDVPRRPQDVEQRLAHAAESLAIVARACDRMKLVLAVESPLPHLVGGDPDEFGSVLQRLSPSVGVCLDTGHTTLGHHWWRFLEVAGPRLTHVHANDHRGQHDDHLAPGDGVIDWRAIRDGLAGVSFDGWIMLELKCPHEPLAQQTARAFAQLQSRLGDGPGLVPAPASPP